MSQEYMKNPPSDVWDHIDTQALREEYWNMRKEKCDPIENPLYGLVFLLVRNQDFRIPLKGKYAGKYFVLNAGEKWTTHDLFRYLEHYLPWNFTISPLIKPSFGGGGSMNGWYVSRVGTSITAMEH